MFNALTVDVEYWWCNEFLSPYLPEKKESFVVEATELLLDIFDKYKVKTTFFILGKVAENHPEMIKKIHKKGHEIGNHAYSHKPLYNLSKKEVEREIKTTDELIYSITGEKPVGFRAPHASITNKNKWILDILKKLSYKYDSSVFPVKTNLYGIPNAPVNIYRPSRDDISKHDDSENFIEVPLSAIQLFNLYNVNLNVPLGGGFYFRFYPYTFFKLGIRKINKENRPFIGYIHPWEFYGDFPDMKIPLLNKLEATWGRGEKAIKKLEKVLINFKFKKIYEIIEKY